MSSVLFISCIPPKPSVKKPNISNNKAAKIVELNGSEPINLAKLFLNNKKDITYLQNYELLWAAASCNCVPKFIGAFLKNRLQLRGALPEFLVPSVRQEVLNNPQLKLLDNLPFKEFLTGMFVSDSKLVTEIKKGVLSKIQTGTSENSSVLNGFKSNFDLFKPLVAVANGFPNSFIVRDLMANWMAVFAYDGLWEQSQSLLLGNSLQAHELLRTLAEWQYIFALEKNSANVPFGNLLRDPLATTSQIKSYTDLRIDTNAKFYFSGKYSVSISQAKDILSIIKTSKETWRAETSQKLELVEQARLWHIAAKAFLRLRSDKRNNISNFFSFSGTSQILPNNVHEITLLFLQSMNVLLNDIFISTKNADVFHYAKIHNVQENLIASLTDVNALSEALMAWIDATKGITEQMFEASTTFTKLEAGKETLRKGLKVTVDYILKELINKSLDKSSIAQSAKAISLLIRIESKYLKSKVLENKIDAGIAQFFNILVPKEVSGAEINSAQKIVNLIYAIQLLDEYKNYRQNRPSWIDTVYAKFKNELSSWENNYQ